MEIKKMLVPESRYSVLCPFPMNPTEITFHNTYNDATALNERNNVANNSTGTSFHIAVDDKEAIQLIPFNRNAWHAGDGNGPGNRNSIGIEICYSMSGGERYRQAELNAIQVIRQLMDMFNIPISKVKTHQERNGKYCPHRMINEGRVQWFKQQLVSGSGETIQIPETPQIPQPPITSGTGIAYITGKNVNLRKGPGTQYDSIRKLNAPENYKVWGRSGGWLNLGGDQWVYENSEWLCFEADGQSSTTSQPSNDGVGVVTITADVLRVRTGPGTNYGIEKNVYQGEKYQSWGCKDGWYNVGFDQWVSGEYVRFEK
ncbi:N-acetylmuramoyl-L-alanine amidase [Bacillus cereus]|uniref:N-acetylmuramoyl-L-alanine amidase n=1 Tax=Bacillus cereus TaxID=1396 RepID=UPI00027AB80E|nr:N-acetylmuramoyl-L-alanine amidase [Bacillus cereus]EJS63483.1 N-acetylmuramoyl-L-alanine amidase CwlA [Bacillus cereus BAG2X1-3]